MNQSRPTLSDDFFILGADQKISPDVWEDLRVLLAFSRAGTIAKSAEGGVEAIAVGTPIDLARIVNIPVPNTRVRYELQVIGQPTLEDVLAPILKK